jgi:hypothetical protein
MSKALTTSMHFQASVVFAAFVALPSLSHARETLVYAEALFDVMSATARKNVSILISVGADGK